MLVYVDESGTPYPKDASTWSVLAGVCVDEDETHRRLSRSIYAVKRRLLGEERSFRTELKANDHLRRTVIEKSALYRELIESVFSVIDNLDLAIFAVAMPRPERKPVIDPLHLPPQYRFLLQRVDALMDQSHVNGDRYPGKAIMLFDGESAANRSGLAARLSRFLFLSAEGQRFQRVLDTPLFVDSRVTPGIQVADLVAGCIRHCLVEGVCNSSNGNLTPAALRTGDVFLSALARYYRVIRAKMPGVEEVEQPHYFRPPLFFMSEDEWAKVAPPTPVPERYRWEEEIMARETPAEQLSLRNSGEQVPNEKDSTPGP